MKEISHSREMSITARAMQGFHRAALIVPILIATIGTVLAILVNWPQTHYPDYLRRSRLSSLNLVKCNPEPSVPMRCIMLGNGEHFIFENADIETVLRWTRSRIEKDYSEEVGKVYWESFRQGSLGAGTALMIAAAVYFALAVLGRVLMTFGRTDFWTDGGHIGETARCSLGSRKLTKT
jgi:hypothetical protein